SAGHDVYTAHDLSQGAGYASGLGMLVDDRGNDVYFSWVADVQGHGVEARGYGSVGVHLDLGGLDRHRPNGRNNAVQTHGRVGVMLDAEVNKSEGSGPIP